MKVDPRRVAAFLSDPGDAVVVLLYGEDAGLIRQRAIQLAAAVAGSVNDPFRVLELSRDQARALPVEAVSGSMTGGRRVIMVREAADSWSSQVGEVLSSAVTNLVILEGAGLPPRSRLRALVEGAPRGAAIACYPDDARGMTSMVHTALAETGASATSDAVEWLVARLGSDRAQNLQEVGRLALFTGAGGHLDLPGAMAASGDIADLSLEDAWLSATAGHIARADRALEAAMAEGGTAIGAIRAGLLHLQRLHRCAVAIRSGLSVAEAIKGARPPFFFRSTGLISHALTVHGESDLAGWLRRLFEAELACKQTSAPAETICRGMVMSIARASVRVLA